MGLLEQLQLTEEQKKWLAKELLRRAAGGYEQAGLLADAARCWQQAGDTARAAALYLRLGDEARAAPLLLGQGQFEAALGSYRRWLGKVAAEDEVGQVKARLGIAACQRWLAGATRAGRAATAEQADGRGQYLAALALIEAEEERGALAAGRCWAALGEYGQLVGRADLVQVGYELALGRLGAGHAAERAETLAAYRRAAANNRLLGQELAERAAAWAAAEAEEPGWERWRTELEGLGFAGGMRDVLHFAAEERQLRLWEQLAQLENQPEQAAIDAYLAGLAPAGLVYIPAGPFMMGSSAAEVAGQLSRENDNNVRQLIEAQQPQHQVRLGGYYLGRYPVTNAEYAAFIEAGGYQAEQYWTEAGWRWKGTRSQPRYWDDANFNQPQQPVVGVSWYEAVAYCRWRGGRLPTEAEWEKAAGWDPAAGRSRRYPWGDAWDERRCNINKQAGERTSPVGQYSPAGDSYYGCADMAGNVYEWCASRWGEQYWRPDYGYPYDPADGREADSGGDRMLRIVRGGSWATTRSPQDSARCAFRNRGNPDWDWDYNRGYRLCAPRRPPLLNAES